jgi:transposase
MPVENKKAKAGRTEKKRIDLELRQIDELLARAEVGILQEGDYEIIKAMADCIVFLSQSVDEKAAKIKKLLRMIFGATTEKKENVLSVADDDKTSSEAGEKTDGSSQSKGEEEKAALKGHGRNGADDYPGATRVEITHPDLKPNDPCPKCEEGKLYKLSEPGVEIRLKGAAPLTATVYELEKLRCNVCGIVFTAPLPESAGEKKYDTSAAAMIILLKYGYGLPFNRLAGLQANLGIPLPSSTQWDVIKETTALFQPAYRELIYQGAQGQLFFNDDTTMKVLALIKENQEKDPARKGMFTTGIVSSAGSHKIALFFTGRRHAGENLNEVLSQRKSGLATPLQMCDALDRNVPEDFKVVLFNCLIHARRNFVDATLSFPEECTYVIETLAEVYKHDRITKEQDMSAGQRLEYHKANSGPLMDGLHTWLNAQLNEQRVEPNSSLGGAIQYMLKRWHKLTGFLHVPGAPLDNNICERALKKAILHRKNSLFFKTENGAAAGDMFHSLIHTCELSGVNSHDYLMALLNHSALVRIKPREWMPWNYKDTISHLPSRPPP